MASKPPEPGERQGESNPMQVDSASGSMETGSPQQQAPGGSPSPSQTPSPVHPIEAVAGEYVQIADLLKLRLPDGDHAFSASTRSLLADACRVPVGETVEGRPVVGPASFLRAALAWGVRGGGSMEAFNMAEALTGHVVRRSQDTTLQERLASLIPAKEGAGVAPEPEADAVADLELTRVLADAAAVTRALLPSQVRVDVSHALVAALRAAPAQRALFELDLVGSDPSAFFVGLARAAGDHLRQELEAKSAGEAADPSVLDQVLTAVVLDPAAVPAPHSTSEARYVADLPAASLADDRLGMAVEARALAEVICLREPGPPLAIGLFGDWGSGKSTFMNMIEGAVEELTARTAGDDAARYALVSNVVHVRFNAWHYNDANLWASITSEFFRQLRVGGDRARRGTDYARLVQDVLERVQELEGEAAGSAETALEARREAETIRAALESLEARQRKDEGEALAETARSLLSRAVVADAVANALAALGHPLHLSAERRADPQAVALALEARLDLLRAEIDRAAALPGRLAVFLRAVAGTFLARGERTVAGLLYGALVLGVVVLLVAGAVGLQQLTSAVLAAAAAVAAGGGALARIYRTVEPIFRAADDFTVRRRELEEATRASIAEGREKLADAEKRAAGAEAERARREAEAARFRGGTPEQVFDYYLNVSQETRQFEAQLGTVSQVRRAFEQLDAIFQERERLRRLHRKAGAGGADGVEEAKELARLDAVTQGIDRIVLYIDDLDRCQVQQVVKVLEAVHLLLAFPLFVVVVGVDARWLQQSLLEFYQRQLRDPDGAARVGAGLTGADTRATVQDYLEKIFQIPIRLGRLSGAPDARFRDYLESVAGPVDRGGTGGAGEEDGGQGGGNGPSEGRAGIWPVQVQLKEAPETGRATVERITLGEEELECIAELAPFLGKSPRAVKRFMNIYRLVRGLHRGDDLDRFLKGADGAPAAFPAYQFWLAADNGLRPEDVDRYRLALEATRADGLILEELADWMEAPPPENEGAEDGSADATADGSAPEVVEAGGPRDRSPDDPTQPPTPPHGIPDLVRRRLRALERTVVRRHASALRALDQRLPGEAGLDILLLAEAETRRFSMRSR